jgi:hypothetical protein
MRWLHEHYILSLVIPDQVSVILAARQLGGQNSGTYEISLSACVLTSCPALSMRPVRSRICGTYLLCWSKQKKPSELPIDMHCLQ